MAHFMCRIQGKDSFDKWTKKKGILRVQAGVAIPIPRRI